MKIKLKQLNVGDVIKTKKTHPCGSDTWKISRKGADFKIVCTKCDRIVLVDAKKISRMIKEVN